MRKLIQIPSLTRREIGKKALFVADALKAQGHEVKVQLNPTLRDRDIIGEFGVRNLTPQDFIFGGPVDQSEFDKVHHENDFMDVELEDFLFEEYEELEEEIEEEPVEEPEEIPEEEPEGEKKNLYCDCGKGPFNKRGLSAHQRYCPKKKKKRSKKKAEKKSKKRRGK